MPTRRAILPLLLAPAVLRAQQAWPSQPLRFVVPFGPGGSSDIIMRLMAPRIGALLGQPIVIDNRPGAGSTVGTDFVAKATDRHTFAHATLSGIGIAPALYPRLSYDPLRDLAPIAPTALVPFAMTVTTRGWDIRSAQALIETLRASPGRYQYGSPGIGSTGHLANANFVTRIGATVEHIPYRAGAQSTAALLAGEVHFTHEVYGIVAQHHREGRARALFVTAPEPTLLLPGVPTMEEARVPHYRAYSWFGVFGPTATPPDHVARIAAAVADALAEPAVAARLEDLGTPAMPRWTPARFAEFVAEEVREWAPLVRASGAQPE
jgi:tripartite-type tricarboxylate transporter receptor subunit TctC